MEVGVAAAVAEMWRTGDVQGGWAPDESVPASRRWRRKEGAELGTVHRG